MGNLLSGFIVSSKTDAADPGAEQKTHCACPLLAAAGTTGAASTVAHLAQTSETWKVMLNLNLIILSLLIQAMVTKCMFYSKSTTILHKINQEFS